MSKKTWVIEFEYDENSINVHEVAIMHDLNSLKKIDGVKVTEVKNE